MAEKGWSRRPEVCDNSARTVTPSRADQSSVSEAVSTSVTGASSDKAPLWTSRITAAAVNSLVPLKRWKAVSSSAAPNGRVVRRVGPSGVTTQSTAAVTPPARRRDAMASRSPSTVNIGAVGRGT
eukprot:scaffold10269_cov102-Isochrysis_galbana.AAC.7